MVQELKPCPFCGALPTLESPDGYGMVGMHRVWCANEDCVTASLCTEWHDTAEAAIKAWNTRQDTERE